jgi:hypothetical protein
MTELTVIPPELTRADLYVGIAEDGVASLQAGFAPHFLAFHACKDEAAAIAADQPKAARALRLKLKAIRVDAEKTRKALKEDSLRRGKAIDGVNALLEYQLVPVEQAMEEIEKAEERREAERKAALKADREEQLRPYCAPDFYDLGNMPEPQFQDLLAGQKAAKAERERLSAEAETARIAAEKAAAEAKAEADRLAAESAAKAEAERQAEMARLRAEREAAAKAQAEAEAKAAAEKAAADAKLAQERKEAAEREAKAKAEADAKLAAERAAAEAERQRIAAEAAKAKAEADRLAAAEAARVAAENAKAEAEAKAAKEAAAAPERQKVQAFAAMLRALQVPALDTEEGRALAARIGNNVMRLADFCDIEAGKL